MILIVGMGAVGQEVAKHYPNHCCYFDDCVEYSLPKFSSWDNIEFVVKSPGISFKHPIIQQAIYKKIPIKSDIEIFLKQPRNGIKIGVTGTNGKSTLCALLHHILGQESIIGGNFGKSPINFEEKKYYILELSSYQLEALDEATLKLLDISIVINIFPSHLDRHGTFEEYKKTKEKILHAKNPIKDLAEETDFPDSQIFKRTEYQQAWRIIKSILKLINFDETLAKARARTYSPLQYRQEIIATDPILIINDSKATNAIAAQQAFSNIEGEFCLIAGGAGHSNWPPLDAYLEKIRKVFVIGEKIDNITNILKNYSINYEIVHELKEATSKAINFAKEHNITLLFAPGYQSFDQFKNFEDRGQKFNEYVQIFLTAN